MSYIIPKLCETIPSPEIEQAIFDSIKIEYLASKERIIQAILDDPELEELVIEKLEEYREEERDERMSRAEWLVMVGAVQ